MYIRIKGVDLTSGEFLLNDEGLSVHGHHLPVGSVFEIREAAPNPPQRSGSRSARSLATGGSTDTAPNPVRSDL